MDFSRHGCLHGIGQRKIDGDRTSPKREEWRLGNNDVDRECAEMARPEGLRDFNAPGVN
jgi:hypothetical protein